MSEPEVPRGAGFENRGKDETRARILMAARDCFSRNGFDRTSMRNIAAACGLTDAAIYYYFPSKRHLLEALWTVRTNGGLRGLTPEATLTEGGLRALNDGTLDFMADNHQLMRLMARGALDGDEVARALRNETRATWRNALHQNLATVAETPEVNLAADLIMSLITGLTMRAHMELGDEFEAEARDEAFRDATHQACMALIDLPLAPGPA
ncbi:MAG TPA: helix-turn-helix domain-containing protein [Tepidiformaceae bacterium]|nr:helix-turn-helix domain-containing protein [Tepidiformaceae bacterium]